jgi:hypothetical protein
MYRLNILPLPSFGVIWVEVEGFSLHCIDGHVSIRNEGLSLSFMCRFIDGMLCHISDTALCSTMVFERISRSRELSDRLLSC